MEDITQLISVLKNRPYLLKIIKNAWWLFVDKFFRLLVSLFVVIFIVRSLGPSGFGEFSFAHNRIITLRNKRLFTSNTKSS